MTKYLFFLSLILCVSRLAQAYDPLAGENETYYVEPDEKWQEDAVRVPEHFNPDDLQSFTFKRANKHFTYAIEKGSLQTGSDGVTRFLVVIRSDRGAVNSSYEGLRCGHREYKVYAYGSGGGLTPLSDSEWQPIPRNANDYRVDLYEDLICNLLTGKSNPSDAIFQAMRNNSRVDAPFIHSGRD